ncbi:brachyurin [Diabrotica virgifera virgifera]|uniref:Brachyurin-like n=2 Tax=Diabrotica virgifera virgifera TaxID=50390 RepID=A0A6P7FGS6_DIAVI|nr:brachyurin [Diabrotica virgifera virgifera]
MLKFSVILGLLTVSLALPSTHNEVYKLGNTNQALKIINGNPAKPHQFPYQVGMYVYTSSRSDFCGGSLISPNYVLTAAHCVDKAVRVNMVFGAHNITDPEEKSQVRLSSTSFIVHEGWDGDNINKNDIALIKLPSPVQTSKVIKTVSIAAGTNKYVNSVGNVAGWGLTKNDQTVVTPVLRYISPSILSNDDCKKVDQDYEAVILDTLLCSNPGSHKQGTCQGDSGGPLVVNGVQIGIVSFGSTDCEEGKPSIFTRVTEYHDWIAKHSDVKF